MVVRSPPSLHGRWSKVPVSVVPWPAEVCGLVEPPNRVGALCFPLTAAPQGPQALRRRVPAARGRNHRQTGVRDHRHRGSGPHLTPSRPSWRIRSGSALRTCLLAFGSGLSCIAAAGEGLTHAAPVLSILSRGALSLLSRCVANASCVSTTEQEESTHVASPAMAVWPLRPRSFPSRREARGAKAPLNLVCALPSEGACATSSSLVCSS